MQRDLSNLKKNLCFATDGNISDAIEKRRAFQLRKNTQADPHKGSEEGDQGGVSGQDTLQISFFQKGAR